MTWQIRHEGSPKSAVRTIPQIVDGLRDGQWSTTDEVRGPGEPRWRRLEDHPQFANVVEELEAGEEASHDDETSLDMNALIDVCMVLLIFFIITTTHVAVVQKIVPLAEAKTNKKTGARTVNAKTVLKYMVRVKADGQVGKAPRIHVEDEAIDAADGDALDVKKLSEAIRKYVRAGQGKTEVLLAARNISWGQAIAIQDAAKAAGVRKIHRLKE